MPPGELEGQVNTKITTRLKTDLPSHPVTEWVELRGKKKGGGSSWSSGNTENLPGINNL